MFNLYKLVRYANEKKLHYLNLNFAYYITNVHLLSRVYRLNELKSFRSFNPQKSVLDNMILIAALVYIFFTTKLIRIQTEPYVPSVLVIFGTLTYTSIIILKKKEIVYAICVIFCHYVILCLSIFFSSKFRIKF